MSPKRHCAKCAAALTSVGSEVLCPGCLLEAGLKVDPGEGQPISIDDLSVHAASDPFIGFFGNYELLEEIARGGMGVVYRARQIELNRLVAVKLLLSGPLASPELVQRFRSEAAAAASLQHPNIVAIHEVGFCEGQHFIAMDYVPGRSLADIARDGPLDARRAAGYVKIVAEAIHFAHERKLLHRDLKPSNILVDESDTPRVTDFGLAKRLETDSELTLSGQVLGSPSYISPEQATAKRGLVGPRSDIYSLGAILFHLLTGRPPFVGTSVADTLDQALRREPLSPRVLVPGLSRDLETICLKCLEKQPERRYGTAQELADELASFLRDEPIRARPVTRLNRAWRWTRRNPVISLLVATVALLAAAGFLAVLWEWLRAEHNSAVAQAQRDLTQGRLYAVQMRQVHANYQAGEIGGALELLRAWEPTPERPDLRGFEWRWLQRLCSENSGKVLATNSVGFSAIDSSSLNQTIALGASDGTVRLIDSRTGKLLTSWQAHPAGIDSVVFFPRRPEWLATVGGDDGLLKIWNSGNGRLLCSTNCSKGLFLRIAMSSSGRLLAVDAADRLSMNVWQVSETGTLGSPHLELRRTLSGRGPAAFSPDEGRLAFCLGFQLALYDLTNGNVELLRPAHADSIHAAAFSPDGKWLATGSSDATVALWDVGRRARERLFGDSQFFNISALVFSSDSLNLFAATTDQNVREWKLGEPERTWMLRGHSAGVNALAFAPDRSVLISAGHDGTSRQWHTGESPAPVSDLPPEFEVLAKGGDSPPALGLAVSPDQRTIAVSFVDDVRIFDLTSNGLQKVVAPSRVFNRSLGVVHSVAFSPEGKFLALGGKDGWVALLDATTLLPAKEPIHLHDGQVSDLAFARDGRVLVSGGGGGAGVALTDVAGWRSIRRIETGGYLPLQALAVSPDGTRLVTGSPDHAVCLWDIDSGQLLAKCPQRVRFPHALAFSPDGRVVAFSDEFGAFVLWDLSGHSPVRRRTGHRAIVTSLAFAPDGRTLASASMDHTIRLWHPDIDQEVAILTGHSSWVFHIAFAANGNVLASGAMNGSVKIWRAMSFEDVAATSP